MRVFLFLIFSSAAYAHPHHHSIAIVDYNNETRQLELGLKILTEDFEKINQDKKAEANSMALTAVYQGREEEHGFMWFYYTLDVELSPVNSIITVTNTILKSFNENQFNTVKINLFEQSQAHNFLIFEQQYSFIFK